MGKFTESKIFNIIFAILIAGGLWVYVINFVNDESTKQISIPVTVLGEDLMNNKSLMIDPSVKLSISLRITGGRNTLVGIVNNPADYYAATVDVSTLDEAGEYDLPVKVSAKNAMTASFVSVEGKNEQTIQVSISKMMEKDIEVRTHMISTNIPAGYRSNMEEITPSTIRIQGPESVVSRIQYAQVDISAGELTKTYSADLGFEFIDAAGQVVESPDVTANVDSVSVIVPVVKTLDLPLNVEFLYGGGITKDNFDRHVTVDIEPKSIQVSGDEEDIAAQEGRSITLRQIDLSAVGEGGGTYKFPILLPSELTNDSGVTEATVTIQIQGLDTRVIETSNIEIINADPFTATAVTQSLQVTVRGPADALEAISGYQIRAVVDLKEENLTPGQFNFKAKIYLDGDGQCGVITNTNDGYGVVVNVQ